MERRGVSVGGRLPPEQDMLERYGVARATLREALRFLELQGAIALKTGPGGGPVVRAPDPMDFASTVALQLQFVGATFRSLIEMRHAVGPMMAALAAERASGDDIAALKRSVAMLKRLPGNSPRYVEEHRRFHDHVAWASRNPLMGFQIAAVHYITNASGVALTYTEQERAFQIKSYARLLEAIEQRDAGAAREEMESFLSRSLKYMEARYPDVMSQPVRWRDMSNVGALGPKKVI